MRRVRPTSASVGLPALAAPLLSALVAVLLASCSRGIGPDVGESGVVLGTVTVAASGDPVVDARVDVTAFSGICGSDIFTSTSVRTDGSGRYVTGVINFRAPVRRGCLEVEATPPDGAGLRSEAVELPNVSFSGSGVDSLEVPPISLDSASR